MSDNINSPSHYRGADGTETIDLIEAVYGGAGHLPQAVAYILRHKRKGSPADDLAKARWYVSRIRDRGLAFTFGAVHAETVNGICDNYGIPSDDRARWALRHIFHAGAAANGVDAETYLGRAIDCLTQAIDDLRATDPVPAPHPPQLPRNAPEMAASLSPIATS